MMVLDMLISTARLGVGNNLNQKLELQTISRSPPLSRVLMRTRERARIIPIEIRRPALKKSSKMS